MKIMKVLYTFFVCLALLPLHLGAVLKQDNNDISTTTAITSVISQNDLLKTISQNAAVLVNQMQSGKRNEAEKKNALEEITKAENDLSADVKKLVQPHIAIITSEVNKFFKHHGKPLVKYDYRTAENALADLATTIINIAKDSS